MAECEVCGNDYDKSFEVIAAGDRHTFDSLSAPSHAWRPGASTAGAPSSGTGPPR